MLKKICCIAIALLCLLPNIVFANDAAPIIDKNENLSVSINLINKEVQIGGTLDFTVTLKNNTSEPISDWYLFRIFSNTTVSNEVSGKFSCYSNYAIQPYETVVWNVSEKITSDIHWYEKDGSYYTDFDFLLDYYAYNNGDDYDTGYYYESKKTPIKLINLNNGSPFVNIVTVENEDTVYLGNIYHSDYDSSISDVGGNLNSELSITNTSGFELNDLIIRKDIDENIKFGSFKPQENIRTSFEYSFWMDEAEVPKELPLSFSAIFTINNKYYAVKYTKRLPAEFIDLPELELTLTPVNDRPNLYSLSVKNISGKDYTNFYFDGDASNYFSRNNLIDTFANKQILNTGLFDTDDTGFLNIIYGYIKDDKLFAWHVFYYYIAKDNQTEEIDTLYFLQPIEFTDGKFIIDEPQPSPLSSLSPSPILEPTITPAPSPSMSPKPQSTPAFTPTPIPIPSPTSAPTPAVTVNSVTRKPAIPLWVWIALGCALLGAGLLSIFINIRRIKK